MINNTDTQSNPPIVIEIKSITANVLNTAMARAESRLETWENKSYYERVASLAKVADQMPDKKDPLLKLIALEIKKLLTQSHDEIVLI